MRITRQTKVQTSQNQSKFLRADIQFQTKQLQDKAGKI